MSFFKDLENTDEIVEEEKTEEVEEVKAEEAEDDDLVEIEEAAEENKAEEEEIDSSLLTNLFDENIVDDISTEEFEEEEDEEEESGEEQCTIITKGTTINGNIVSDSSLNIMGKVNGDIECMGKLTITGTVAGNSVASDVYVNAKRLEGNIESEGSIKVGLGTIVIGDMKGTSAVIGGAVKGEIDVKGPVILDSTAIIKGNINAKSVQINSGAVLEGFCKLSYADVDIEHIFD